MSKNDNLDYKISYETLYHNEKTYYKINDKLFNFKNKLTGKSLNAKKNSYYIILSNNNNITFEEVDKKFWSSYLDNKSDFVIVEHGFLD